MVGRNDFSDCGFQSRNRDAFHIRAMRSRVDEFIVAGFQSRNREAFHIRLQLLRIRPDTRKLLSFNLAIEMLFISGLLRSR